MKVLNLQCSRQHGFEGWFASEDDFQDQLGRAFIACPMCADTAIHKLPSAPRLNFGAPSSTSSSDAAPTPSMAVAPSPQTSPASAMDPAQAAFLKAVRQLVAKTEDVGTKFAEEARRIHYGETEPRDIRGQASLRETVDLMEEGIEVMPLPMLPGLKETLQ